jgi:hypothetical protein
MGKTRLPMRKIGNRKVGIRVAICRGMNQSFASEINRIATQARAVELHELKAQRRRELFAKVRRFGMIVLGLALVAGGVYYRQQIQQTVQDKFFSPSKVGKIDEATGEKLKDIQVMAKKRDAALDELTK